MFFIPVYIVILFATIVIDYFAGISIENSNSKTRKKNMLVLSLIANIGVLAVFKYYNFFIENINQVITVSGFSFDLPLLNIILPIGLSFHTFQAMSYTIEVYRGNQKAERNFGLYALYVMFYPQLVAGPIERPQNIIHQFKIEHKFNYEAFVSGLRLVLWGLIKKVIIADRLAEVVNEVYGHNAQYGGGAIVLATIFFAVQIYCDFSGYSDIAIGTARTMGFDLMKNFDMPYFSMSISEFWRRWHMSLSTWFRDYVYIPLGGSKHGKQRWYFNLLFIFLLSGLWHGANWTYVVWGGLLGVFLIVEAGTQQQRKSLQQKLNPFIFNLGARFITISLICITWVFFRATSIKHSMELFSSITNLGPGYFHLSRLNLTGTTYVGMPLWKLLYTVVLIPALFVVESSHRQYNIVAVMERKPFYLRWSFYYILILSVLILGTFDTKEFIYFQF